MSVTACVSAAGGPPRPHPQVGLTYQRIDLMGASNDDNERWPDLVEWNHIWSRQQASSGTLRMSDDGHLVLRGVLAIDDSIGLAEVAKESRPPVTGSLATGDYVLELLDRSGAVRSSRTFGVDARVSEVGLVTSVGFAASTPWTPEAVAVQLRRGARILWSRSLSGGAPSVTVLEPAGGMLSGEPTTIRWIASDGDGDPLTYSVYYVRDDGSPVPIARGQQASSLEWDPAGAGGCVQGRIVVVASDGWNEGHGASASFALPDQLPAMTFLWPPEGSTLPAGAPVMLAGAGVDPEDGPLPPESLSMRSDLDGDLGTGATLLRVLREGRHHLTLRGVDAAGNVAETTLDLSIGRADRVPVIESLDPGTAPPALAVTITGRSFDPTSTRVFFDATEAAVVSVTSTECVARVPEGLAPGQRPVTVVAYGVTSIPIGFTALGGRPRILSAAPRSGPAGTPVYLRLAEVDAAADVLVSFAGSTAPLLQRENDGLLVQVPADLTPGAVPVVVSTAQGSSVPTTFDVTTGEPIAWVRLDSVSPARGAAGTMLVLQGSGWAPELADNVVHFGDVVASPAAVAGSALHVLVPEEAAAGPLLLWVGARGSPSAAVPFTVEPDRACMGPPPGVLGWWAGEQDAEDRVGAYPGELRNGAGFAPGKVGHAFSLDGMDDYIQIADDGALALGDALTIEAWVAPTGPGSAAEEGGVLIHTEGQYTLARFADGTVRWNVAGAGHASAWVDTGAVVPLGQWTHVAWVYDHGTVRTYMNGEWVHDSVVGGATSPAVNDLRLGGRRRDDQCFEGLLDEVTLYDWVLSPLEIRAVCDADSAGKCLPLHPGTTTLAIAAVGGDVVLSWPAGQSEYILEATPDLASPEGWARVTALAAVVGDLIRVIVHPHAGQQFFRLRTDAGTGGDSPPGRR